MAQKRRRRPSIAALPEKFRAGWSPPLGDPERWEAELQDLANSYPGLLELPVLLELLRTAPTDRRLARLERREALAALPAGPLAIDPHTGRLEPLGALPEPDDDVDEDALAGTGHYLDDMEDAPPW